MTFIPRVELGDKFAIDAYANDKEHWLIHDKADMNMELTDTVKRNLAAWLIEHGYAQTPEAEDAST